MNDAELAAQLNTPWEEIFGGELKSQDIESVRG